MSSSVSETRSPTFSELARCIDVQDAAGGQTVARPAIGPIRPAMTSPRRAARPAGETASSPPSTMVLAGYGFASGNGCS